jgi:hypothetical protein
MARKIVVSVRDTDWRNKAERLVQERKPFVFAGWRFSFDNQICRELARQYNYVYRTARNPDKAFLNPAQAA